MVTVLQNGKDPKKWKKRLFVVYHSDIEMPPVRVDLSREDAPEVLDCVKVCLTRRPFYYAD